MSGLIGLVKRSDELDRLHGLFESGNAQLAVVYGRGRLGKPSLVKKTLEDRENAPIVDVGQWWYQDYVIDVVGLTDSETLVVGECEYQDAPLDYGALASLERHVEELRWQPSGGGTRTVEYALFSLDGFTDSVQEAAAERNDVLLYTIGDVVHVPKQ